MNDNANRINDYKDIDLKTAQRLFSEFDSSIEVTDILFIPEGLSTSNYILSVKDKGKRYLLKIYPDASGNCRKELAANKYAKQFVNVPEIYLFDDSKIVYELPYMIMEYIDGISLKKYIIQNNAFSEKITRDIGKRLALLHNREYEEMAFLDENLHIQKILPQISMLFEQNLNGIPGTHLSIEIKNEVFNFISKNVCMLKTLESKYVFSHGDFNPNNILIDSNNNIWFIDFEYSLATSIYCDIGKFFRKRADLDKYIDINVFENFAKGYNSVSKFSLPDDWIKLAKLIDVVGMLGLIDKEDVPECWIREIENAIIHTMKVLKNEVPF